ncbi:hypothetical protein [Solitalea longa]|uniref:hypothetical protein n=1 Tax=Solitalea longa TaxID=2079460 RepID=UPI001056E4C8|nr:hypothetical protein [Solitalea longa]
MTLSRKVTTIAKLSFVSGLGCLLMFSMKYRLDIDFRKEVVNHQLWQLSSLIMLVTTLAIVSSWLIFSLKIALKKK